LGRQNPLRNLLNRLVWDANLLPDDYVIVYISRGAPGDLEEVRGSAIVKVWARGFEIKAGNKTKYIPFHRIVEIKNIKTGEVLFRSPRYRL